MGQWVQTAGRAVPWRWVLYWLVVPNLLIILMWPIGGPLMRPTLLLFGLTALLVSQLPWIWAKRALLLAMMCLVTLHYACALFNISPLNAAVLPTFLIEVHPLRSPEYLIAGAVFLAAAGLALLEAPRLPRLNSARLLAVGLIAVLALAQADAVAKAGIGGTYHASPGPGDPFSSATGETGLVTPPTSRRHVVLILVEGLGVPTEAPELALFDADWRRPRWRTRYSVQHGLVPYYGSTTNGELRELCGVWGEYFRFDFARADCLPERYGEAGYHTVAMHAFVPAFFDRETWYPMLAFDEMEFASQLIAKGARRCGGMWPGACDVDLPAQIAERLKQADEPQFVYWLTLNTHLPVIADTALGTDHCVVGEPVWRTEHPHLCRMFQLHHRLADAIDEMVMDPRLPPTDFLIVGDHMPPLFGRRGRLRFDSARVPWIYLRSRDEAPADMKAAVDQ